MPPGSPVQTRGRRVAPGGESGRAELRGELCANGCAEEIHALSVDAAASGALQGRALEELVDFGEVRRIWSEHQGGLFDNSTRLWYLLMLGCWKAHHGSRQGELAESLAGSVRKTGR